MCETFKVVIPVLEFVNSFPNLIIFSLVVSTNLKENLLKNYLVELRNGKSHSPARNSSKSVILTVLR